MTLDDCSKISIGTKVKYKDFFNETRYGYFVGIFYPTRCIQVSKIKHDDEFTGLKMTDYGVCHIEKIDNVELLND